MKLGILNNGEDSTYMKIKSVTQRVYRYFEIEMEGSEFTYYRTSCNDGKYWEVFMGEVWEPCYSQNEELYEMFQYYIQNNKIMIAG